MTRFGLYGFLLLAAACSPRGGNGILIADDAAGDDVAADLAADDAPVTPDAPPPRDAATEDAPVTPDLPPPEDVAPPPDVTPPPDGGSRCTRDSECSGSTYCDTATGACAPIVCTPGRTSCVSAARARVCNDRGSAFTEMDCPGGCASGVCTGAMMGCAAPMSMCGTACVNTATDVAHCGGCGIQCPSGQSCASGACTGGTTCAAPMMMCGGACVDPRTSNTNCGACGLVCATGQTCLAGFCDGGCSAPRVRCGSVCTDPSTDRANCGVCGRACLSTQSCVSGACTTATTCAAPRQMCGAACVDVAGDVANCGACGRACAAGQACTGGVCGALGTGATLQVLTLGTAGCQGVDHASATGDDRGGIAVSSSQVFYTGDDATGRFSAVDLSGGVAAGAGYDAIFSDLSTQQVYAFGNAAGPFLGTFGGAAFTFDRMFPLNGATGAVGAAVTLSASIAMVDMPNSVIGYFSGAGRVVVANGTRLYDVALPSGAVRDLGAFTLPTHTICESSGFWGVAEFFGGSLYIDYVQSSTAIARTQVFPRGATTTLQTFTNLSDMCSFTVDPRRNRWYWHHEGTSQFRAGDESVGYCPATLNAGPVTCTAPLRMCGTACADVSTDPLNCGACGNACTAGRSCAAGVCMIPMAGGTNYTLTTPLSSVTFTEICALPGVSRVLSGIDDSSVLVPMPFPFTFWGAPLPMGRMVNVSSNGFISLDGVSASARLSTIPTTAAPNGTVAAFLRDIVTSLDGCVSPDDGGGPARRFVVEWYNASIYMASGNVTAEIALNESDGAIDVLVPSNTSAGAATVGVESLDGLRAVGGCTPSTTTLCAVPAGSRFRFQPSP